MLHQTYVWLIFHMDTQDLAMMPVHLREQLHTSMQTGCLKEMSLHGWIQHIPAPHKQSMSTRSLHLTFHEMPSLTIMFPISVFDLSIQWVHSRDVFNVYEGSGYLSTPNHNMLQHVVGLQLPLSCTISSLM